MSKCLFFNSKVTQRILDDELGFGERMTRDVTNAFEEWLSNGVTWCFEKLGDGLAWLGENGISATLKLCGDLSRFMTTEVYSSFILFGILGMFLVMMGYKEKGVKMFHMSIVVYIIMILLGSVL